MSVVTFKNRWIFSWKEDLLVFVLPLLFSWLIIAYLYHVDPGAKYSPPYFIYLISVIFIDFGHVYSTFFRTYFDKEEFLARKKLYIVTPLVCFALTVLVNLYDAILCIQLYMYFNLYHFIRQQYGWMVISARKEEGLTSVDLLLDKLAIYAVTVYPVIWWHFHDKGFQWRDAPYFTLPTFLEPVFYYLYWTIILVYLSRQVYLILIGRTVNLAKYLILCISWSLWHGGIVLSQSLIVLSISQQITHGIPYLYLVYRYEKKRVKNEQNVLRIFFTGYGYVWYLLAILLFGYYAEYWPRISSVFNQSSLLLQSIILGTVFLPSLTHFALDGFIWKLGQRKNVEFRELVATAS